MVKLFISLMTVNLRYIHDFQSENSFTTLNLEKPQPPRPHLFLQSGISLCSGTLNYEDSALASMNTYIFAKCSKIFRFLSGDS